MDNQKRLSYIVATGGQRIGAHLIDGLVQIIATIPLIVYAVQKAGEYRSSNMYNMFLVREFRSDMMPITIVYSLVVIAIFQIVIPVYTKGKTIGKAALGLRMISDYGAYISTSKIIGRSLIYLAALLLDGIKIFDLIFFIYWISSTTLVFSDSHRQALHDMWAGVYVVDDYNYQIYRQEKNKAKNKV